MANLLYNSFKADIGNGNIDWDNNSTTTIKVMLVTSAYAVDIDNHTVISDILNEVSGTGYTAGGNALLNRAITVDTVNNVAHYNGDNVTWVSSTITAAFAIVYKDTGTPTTSPLIAYIDFGGNKSSSAGDFTIQWNADGIFKVA